MKTVETDVAVIGAGTAGLNARREAERQGARTLLIESGPYGTMCARVGCMPSKLLIAAADAAHGVGGAGRFGIEVDGTVRVDGRRVLQRVRAERDRFVGFVVDDTEALPEENRLRGSARFVGPTALEVGAHTRVEARAVVVATGSAPSVPEALQGLGPRLLTNQTVFELEDLPESVAVVGGGIIGLELGQALHRLGVRTPIFVRSDRLGPLTDPEVQASSREVFGRELDLRLHTRVEARARGDGVQVRWRRSDGATGEEQVSAVLAATGREPAVASLDLARAGLVLEESGVPRFDPRTAQCGDAPVFLAGDVTGTVPLLHEASDEGRIAGFNAARFPEIEAHRRRVPLSIVFTDPQIALVGASWAELDAERVAVGSVDYGDQGRARVMGANAGLVRLYAGRDDGRLLGAELFGPGVEHLAHLMAWSVQRGLTINEILELPFYHPVLEEGLRTALRDAGYRLRFVRKPCARELDCGPGA